MRLLLVEDYPPLQKSVVRGLREAGFAVDVTGDGQEALWYAEGNEYDAIVLDLMLPGLDGVSILRRLRDGGRQTHVLIITAKDAVADRVAGLNAGADDYLVKPFEFEELLARVQALVRRTYHRKNPVLAVGPLVIDTSTQHVERGGRIVELTAREYALLEYLAMRAGELVPRTDVWEHVYDFHSDASSNVVDVYVGRLRRKLDQEGEPSVIETVRGRGYILRSDPR
ncbi:MAG: response regulator transcription factor [Pirellulaceae bacterium]